MKITKTSIGVAAAFALSIASFGIALAEKPVSLAADLGVSTSTGIKLEGGSMNAGTNMSAHGSEGAENEQDNTGGQDDKGSQTVNSNNQIQENSQDNENANEDNGATMSASHRSVVSGFVQNLLKIADREGGTGADVRIIAKEQSDANDTTTTAIGHVESRGGIKTFFFGPDYKNIGVLRSEMVKTDTRIEHLRILAGNTTDATDKAELNAQIQVLVTEQTKIQAFITAHENKFSLFGWLAKKN